MNNSNRNQQILYRFFDSEENLVYVGITNDWKHRFHDHERQARWWSEVAKVTFERYEDRESVSAAEIKAIKTEQPKYNKQHHPEYLSPNQHFQQIKFWVHTDIKPDKDHERLVEILKFWHEEDEIWKKQSKHLAYWLVTLVKPLLMEGALCRNCRGMYDRRWLFDWANYSAVDRGEPEWQ